MKLNNYLKSNLFVILIQLLLISLYLLVFFNFDKLQSPPQIDEPNFWKTTLEFSHSLIPDLNLLKNYKELNTPLPFMIWGMLEHLLKGGIFTGRLLNLILSFVMVYLIALPIGKNQNSLTSILAACSLLSFPYYLWLSSVLYTDIIATFFVFLGVCFYTRAAQIKSCLCFILAIASRQYMLVFSLAIFVFEVIDSLKKEGKISFFYTSSVQSKDRWINKINFQPWLTSLIASLSIFGWFLLFGGIAPKTAFEVRPVPTVQASAWSIEPQASLYFLACVGLYFVIPELVLFRPKILWTQLITKKNILIGLIVLLVLVIFPPTTQAMGPLIKLSRLLPSDFLDFALFYVLTLITCIRFSRINLAFWIVWINFGLMIKAYPWDKYLLPLLVVFWYLKSIDALDEKKFAQSETKF
jgi:DIE2/ALG10 family